MIRDVEAISGRRASGSEDSDAILKRVLNLQRGHRVHKVKAHTNDKMLVDSDMNDAGMCG